MSRSQVNLDELERLCAAATPGPWSTEDEDDTVDGRFVAAVRTALPALLRIAKAAKVYVETGSVPYTAVWTELKAALAEVE